MLLRWLSWVLCFAVVVVSVVLCVCFQSTTHTQGRTKPPRRSLCCLLLLLLLLWLLLWCVSTDSLSQGWWVWFWFVWFVSVKPKGAGTQEVCTEGHSGFARDSDCPPDWFRTPFNNHTINRVPNRLMPVSTERKSPSIK